VREADRTSRKPRSALALRNLARALNAPADMLTG
jgi:hypothetical protein